MMKRTGISIVLAAALLAGCGGGSSGKSSTSARASAISDKYTTSLAQPVVADYPGIVDAFVENCVLEGPSTVPASTTLYSIEDRGICTMYVNSFFDDDTVLADLLTTRLKRVDPAFTRQDGTIVGTAWLVGNGRSWSIEDNTPFVSIGRSNAKSILGIRNAGAKVPRI